MGKHPGRIYALQQYMHNRHRLLYFFLASFGALIIFKKLFGFFRLIAKLYFAKQLDLKSRYGENSWAVITGASDGIGKAISLELSKNGFNICLIARNKVKLEAVESEIKKSTSRKVETRVIVVDFMNSHEKNFYDTLFDQIKDLDISILVNNVGSAADSYFENLNENLIREQIMVNCYPIVLLTRKIAPGMLKRPRKSAIVNISSVVGSRPCPYFQVYSATKAFGDFFSRALSLEFEGKIDVLSLLPGQVSTNMTRELKKDFTQISAEECARSCLLRMGQSVKSEGHWIHVIQGKLLAMVSDKKLTAFIRESLQEK